MTELTYDPAWRGDAPISDVSIEAIDEIAEGKGRWPRLVTLDDETKSILRLWIDDELDKFHLERQDMLSNWRNWQTLYWAEPATKERNFPFKKAANIVIPLAAIATEAVHARMMNILFSVEPFWSIRPRSKSWIEAAKPFENYLQSEVEVGDSLDVYEFYNDALLELIKLGTCVGKSGFERVVKKSLEEVGDDEQEVFVTTKNGAVLGRVALSNFIMRFAETDPQHAPLVGEKHKVSWGQLKKLAQSGKHDKRVTEKIKSWWKLANHPSGNAYEGQSVEQQVQKLSNTEPTWTTQFEFVELWLSFDIDGDGWDEEIVVDYHRESGEFLAIRYNWYRGSLHRPYRIANYVNVEGIWPGIGVCKQVEQFQEEATTIHRQRLDNATLANMAQIILRKGMGYGPGEPIFPGKMWFVDDVQNDIKEFKLSEVYPSSYANEESIIRYFEKRSGANEIILGLPQEGTPGTATSDLTRLAEGSKRFDLSMKNVKRFGSDLGVDVVTNMQIFGNRDVHWMMFDPEEAMWVEQVLTMPGEMVRKGALIELNVTDSLMNRDLEQRQWMQLFQIITNYYMSAVQFSQLLGPEVFIQVAQASMLRADEALKRMLETFNIPDSDRFTLAGEHSGTAPLRLPATPQAVGQGGNTGNGGQPRVEAGPSNIGGLPR